MDARRWFWGIVAATGAVLGSVLVLDYTVDPLLRYRLVPDALPYMKGDNRPVIPGLIDFVPFDTVVLGTSMCKNIRPSTVAAATGHSAVNLAMSGSSPWEQATVLRRALATGKTRHVIWGIDFHVFHGAALRGQENLVPYLYDEPRTLADELRYLLSFATAEPAVKTLARRGDARYQRHFDLDFVTSNETEASEFGRAQVLDKWNHRQGYTFTGAEYRLDLLERSFEANVAPLLEDAQGVDFRIFFPPYSILGWKDLQEHGWLDTTLAFKHWLIHRLLQYDNVRLFDFQNVASITHDLDDYRDLTHYSPQVCTFLLEQMNTDAYRIHDDADVEEIRAQLAALDFHALGIASAE